MKTKYKAHELLDSPIRQALLDDRVKEAIQIINNVKDIDTLVDASAIDSILGYYGIYLGIESLESFGHVFPDMCEFLKTHGLSDQAIAKEMVCNCLSVLCTGTLFLDNRIFLYLLYRQTRKIFR